MQIILQTQVIAQQYLQNWYIHIAFAYFSITTIWSQEISCFAVNQHASSHTYYYLFLMLFIAFNVQKPETNPHAKQHPTIQ